MTASAEGPRPGAPPPPWPEPTRDQAPIYTTGEVGRELRQCEIISDVVQYVYRPAEGAADAIRHPLVIVMSQDCDLLWDYESQSQPDKHPNLNGILLYELHPAAEYRGRVPGSDVWRRVLQNKDDRYHFLEAVPPAKDLLGQGFPEMVIDFKRYFTAPPDEIYRQCALTDASGARRRCRLEMPYREHLQSRAAFYLQRVMLPLGHKSAPVQSAAKLLPRPPRD